SPRESKTAQTSKLGRGALPLPALPELCKVFHRPRANVNMAVSHAHEQTLVLCVRARIRPLLCTRDSFRSGPSHQLPQCAVQEILSPASKYFRLPSALQLERKSHIRCLPPNKKSAASSRTPYSAIPKTHLRSSHHRPPTHTQSRRPRTALNLPGAPSSPAPAPSDAPRNIASLPLHPLPAQTVSQCTSSCSRCCIWNVPSGSASAARRSSGRPSRP